MLRKQLRKQFIEFLADNSSYTCEELSSWTDLELVVTIQEATRVQ